MPLDPPGVREPFGQLVRQEAIWHGVPPENIIVIEQVAQTTYEEALLVCQLANNRGWDALVVVTDPFHTRRARICFRQAFAGTGVVLVVRPVEPSWYRPHDWWHSLDGLRETWTEYLKLALHVVGYW